MRIPKRYGQSKVVTCPFCERQAIAKNSQHVPTCIPHKDQIIQEMKCICGSWLDLQISKYGPYFRCFKCGNINWKRVIEINKSLKL